MDAKSRKQYGLLAALSVASSIFQTVGVAAISLFFTVLLDGPLPESVEKFVEAYDLPTLGLLVFTAAVLGSSSSGLATYLGIKVSWLQYRRISGQLLKKYLASSYEWHVQQNSAELISAVLSEVQLAVRNILQQLVLVTVRGTEILLLAGLLFAAKPRVAVVAFISFGIAYSLLYKITKSAIDLQGRLLVQSNVDRLRTATEALKGIKAVKIAKKTSFYENVFQESAERFTDASTKIQYLSLMPKYFIEIILFGSIVGFVIVAHSRSWAIYESIPLLALYGAAAIRMLPAAQQVYLSASTIVSARAVLDKLVNDLETQNSAYDAGVAVSPTLEPSILLQLQDVSYTYPNAERASLNGVTLTIKKGDKIGLVGTTGAGKTTLVDTLLGLLKPNEGKLEVSDTVQTNDHFVAYVPQQLHFLDDTIAGNIAWGESIDLRDVEKIERAARQAKIADFIHELPDGYETPMGEQGIRLSGGQRQRIGIARALYLEPTLLVLDEASNALDPDTERQVLESLFAGDTTIIVIAHRLSTLRNCSRLIVMSSGKVLSEGTFDDLLESCSVFAKLAAADLGQDETSDA